MFSQMLLKNVDLILFPDCALIVSCYNQPSSGKNMSRLHLADLRPYSLFNFFWSNGPRQSSIEGRDSMKSASRTTQAIFAILLAVFTWTGLAQAQSPPTISKAFSTASVPLNGSATLTFTITNPNPATDLTTVSVNDNLPSGLI